MDYQKAVAAVGALIVGVFLTFNIDVSPLVETVGAAVLVLTPIGVAVVRNGGIDTVGYGKAITALGALAVGVGIFFGVDVSNDVANAAGVAMLALPVLVWLVPSAFYGT